MAITITLKSHEPRPHPPVASAVDLSDFLVRSCPDTCEPGKTRVTGSSYPPSTDLKDDLYPSSSSFVRSAIEAWARHSHLVLRPEDFWFTILVQMNFFMTRNADSLRDLFVHFQGVESLSVCRTQSEDIITDLHAMLQSNIKTDWLSDWISPGFSTSTEHDEITAKLLGLGLLKTFFKYENEVICGIPSITLLGQKNDWQRLSRKLDRFEQFGDQPATYATRVRPLLSRILCSFDDPASEETIEFWDQMVHARVKHSSMCGEPPKQYILSGWIVGFFHWDSSGAVFEAYSRAWDKRHPAATLSYDNVYYGETPLELIPVGYARVPLKMIDRCSGKSWQVWMIAGSIGKSISRGAPDGYWATSQARPTEASDRERNEPRAWKRLIDIFNCFKGGSAVYRPARDSGSLETGEKTSLALDDMHSTIQPKSGWFTCEPATDVGPFFDAEEIDGPTVEAIESCENIECQRPGEFGEKHIHEPSLAATLQLPD